MKQNNICKGKLGDQSEFSLRFACWANNHKGKSKAKKTNKRSARRRLNQELQKHIDKE